MTITPDSRSESEVERELTERLAQLARRFIADLQAQGRLVETGGAETLRRLQEQDQAQRALPQGDWPAAAAETAKPPEQVPRGVFTLSRTLPDAPSTPEGTAEDVPQATVVTVAEQPPTVRPSAARTMSADEHGKADWTPAQTRAAAVAAGLRAENAGRLETTQITSDHEGIAIHIHVLSLDQWEHWLTAIGAPLDAPTHRAGWAQTAAGRIDGVGVHLTAYQVPHLLDKAAQAADEPFLLGGRVYDLARGQVDRHGQTWSYLDRRQEDGMPLLTLRGTGGPPWPMDSVVTTNGPLRPAETQTAGPIDT